MPFFNESQAGKCFCVNLPLITKLCGTFRLFAITKLYIQNILVKMIINNAGFCVLVVFWKHPCSYCYIVPIHCTSFLNCRSSPPKDRCVTNVSQKSYFDEFIKSYHVKLKKMKITFMIFLVMKVILDFICQHFKRWESWLNRAMLNKYDKATLEKFIL